MARRTQIALAASCVLLCAPVAAANASVGLLFNPILDLVLAILILAVVEGLALAALLRTRASRILHLMIGANILSLIAGLFALGFAQDAAFRIAPDPPIAAEWFAFLATALAAWAVTILIEWPFTWWGTRASTLSLRARFGMHTLVQTITTALVLTLTVLPDGLSFIREFRDAPPEAVLAGAPRFSVYTMDHNGSCNEIRWDGTTLGAHTIAPPTAPSPRLPRSTRLWGATDPDGTHRLVLSDTCDPDPMSLEIAPGFSGMLWAFNAKVIGPAPFSDPPSPHHAWQDLRPGPTLAWYPRVMVHDRRLRVTGSDHAPTRMLGHRSAFSRWSFSDVIVVQDRLVLAVLNTTSRPKEPRIAALDLRTNTMAILGPGARAYAELDAVPASTR
jgi:hypothetical protein